MKKFLILMVVALFCTVSSNAFGDWAGTYSIDTVTITPPAGGAVWDGSNPANLEVGTTYSVDMDMSYDDSVESGHTFWNTLQATLTFNDSSATFTDVDHAGTIVMGFWDVSTAEYHFDFEIEVTQDMIDDTSVLFSLAGDVSEEIDIITWQDIGLIAEYGVNVSAPVPEPATIMLFGLGLLGLAGVSRRKKA